MTTPTIEAGDLEVLAAIVPELVFADDERKAVLLESGTRDVHAAPGSGKTTILAAKLLMVARKWCYPKRGICVLSHTNVAQEEIRRRLSRTPDGARLLSYPHYIGTIHGFVNHFLALPFLRSSGIQVNVIDDDVFAKQATAMARSIPALRTPLEKKPSYAEAAATLVFKGENLQVGCEKGSLPSANSATYKYLSNIKNRLKDRGVFRYADMFAFAERLLGRDSQIKLAMSHRFPLVYIDEMQDTSFAQESLLSRLFDQSVTVQRFGDINQQIFSQDSDGRDLTFPRHGHLSISTSKRFGSAIAKAVTSVQFQGAEVTGERPDKHAPTLIVYGEQRVTEVINRFGTLVLEKFTDQELTGAAVRAMCTRKQGDAKALPGRNLVDYWPRFAQELGSPSKDDNFWFLLSKDRTVTRGVGTLSDRALSVKRALLILLRAAKCPHAADIRDARYLLRKLEEDGVETSGVRQLVHDLVVAEELAGTLESRATTLRAIFGTLAGILPDEVTHEKLEALESFQVPQTFNLNEALPRACVVTCNGREVSIGIGTVASMKGETHLASLVLESHGGQSKKFDLQVALPVLANMENLDSLQSSRLLKGQIRNLYVAMSRPTQFLCLAANKERLSDECLDRLRTVGWEIDFLV